MMNSKVIRVFIDLVQNNRRFNVRDNKQKQKD